jgi:hypothetical protein
MAVTRKPTEEPTPQTPLPEDPAFQNYLRKGGSSARSEPTPEAKDVRFTMVLPEPLCSEIDTSRKSLLPRKVSRIQWLVEAAIEKLERERKAEAE